MNIIGCLDLPTSGSYILDGRPVSELKEKELTKGKAQHTWICFPELPAYAA